jgi:hypothetical protein
LRGLFGPSLHIAERLKLRAIALGAALAAKPL